MPKRTFWLVTGAAMGAGTSLWAERRVRRSVQQVAARLQPDALVAGVGRSARQVAESAGVRVRDALSSGRDEMQRREEELWADLVSEGVARDPALHPALDPALHPALDPATTPRPHGGPGRRATMRPIALASSKPPLHLGN
ncbi:MAG: hypothetical protein ACRDYE_11110 [Acidimicrobiales bacterium]